MNLPAPPRTAPLGYTSDTWVGILIVVSMLVGVALGWALANLAL